MADQVSGFLSPFLRWRRLAAVRPYLARGRVLDYGCGVGELARHIAADRYLGVDRDAESLARAKASFPSHRFLSPEELPAALDAAPGTRPLDTPAPAGTPAPFDTVVALALIEHLPTPAAWLAQMKRLLAPGGRIVLTTPEPRLQPLHDLGARLGVFSRDGAAEHQSLLDRRGLEGAARKAGLELARYRRFLLGANQLAVLVPGEGQGGTGLA